MRRTSSWPRRLVATALAAVAALAVAPTAGAAAAPTTDQVVQEWYGDFLLREDPAADGGRAFWVGRLDRGERRSDVAWSLTQTREYALTTVGVAYNVYLGRGLDRGAESWVSGVAGGGMAVEWVEQNLLASDEYWAAVGRDRNALVRTWYADVLGRDASRGEVTYWSGRVQQVGRLGALRELWYAQETVDLRVVLNYDYLLGRVPSAGEVAYWRPLERESDRNVQVLIASTPEYERVALSS